MAKLIYVTPTQLKRYIADEIGDFARIRQAADKIVYSKSLETVSTRKTRLEREFDPQVVRGLKSQLHHDVAVGGPTLAAHAIRAGLVDESHLFVAPVIIGGGKPALPGNVRVNLELQDERGFDKGMVIFAIALSGPDGDKVKPTPRLLVREPPANEEVYLTPGCATRS